MKKKQETKARLWLSGNEAIALGAFEAGVRVASAYPGTPSTEILENLCKYEGVYSEWAPNEKVALEVALGASFAGVRALATMKHVGLNVAADPLFTASYTGVRGGLVVVNSSLIHRPVRRADVRSILIPATEIARDAGLIAAASLVLLAVYAAASGAADLDTLRRVIPLSLKKKSLVEVNLKALDAGLAYWREKYPRGV